MATFKESQEERCEVEQLCSDCNCEYWTVLCYGRPVDENAKYHLCPDCYEIAKREGTLEPAIPRRYTDRQEAGTGRFSIGELISKHIILK